MSTRSNKQYNLNSLRGLRLDLVNNVYAKIKDPKDLALMKEKNNTVGKVIATVRTQLEYAKMRKEIPDIAFATDAGDPLA